VNLKNGYSKRVELGFEFPSTALNVPSSTDFLLFPTKNSNKFGPYGTYGRK